MVLTIKSASASDSFSLHCREVQEFHDANDCTSESMIGGSICASFLASRLFCVHLNNIAGAGRHTLWLMAFISWCCRTQHFRCTSWNEAAYIRALKVDNIHNRSNNPFPGLSIASSYQCFCSRWLAGRGRCPEGCKFRRPRGPLSLGIPKPSATANSRTLHADLRITILATVSSVKSIRNQCSNQQGRLNNTKFHRRHSS